MRIVIAWQHYDEYIHNFYRARPELAAAPYQEQLQAFLDDFSGWPGYLAWALQQMGESAELIYANVLPLQLAWVRQHGRPELALAPEQLLEEQIRRAQPEILLLGPWYLGSTSFLRRVRRHCGRLLVWIGSPIREPPARQVIDLVLTPLPHFVRQLEEQGLRAMLFQPACFDPRILEAVPEVERDVAVSFVGGISPAIFRQRTAALLRAVQDRPIDLWGYGLPLQRPRNPLRWLAHARAVRWTRPLLRHHHGVVYGRDMFRVLRRSWLTLNAHIDVARGVAANMRLFEATGCGALLLTEASSALRSYFEPGAEVVTYRDLDDLPRQIQTCFERWQEHEQVRRAGQARTLREHSAAVRAEQLLDVFRSVA